VEKPPGAHNVGGKHQREAPKKSGLKETPQSIMHDRALIPPEKK